MVRPNVSHCITQKDVHYNPIQYFYVRSNMKASSTTTKIKYTEGMKCNIMDYLSIPSTITNIGAYCGYTLIENTNIGDKAAGNPSVDNTLSENGYSFTPSPDVTYVALQQPVSSTGILYPLAQWTFNSTTQQIDHYFILFYIPKYAKVAGITINGIDYTSNSEDTELKVNLYQSFGIGGTTFKRTNSYTAVIDKLSLLQNNSKLEIYPFMITQDDIRVECKTYMSVTIDDREDPSVVLTSQIHHSRTTNPNYPKFITAQPTLD